MRGGEIFVPKIPSMKITDLANVVAPGCKLKMIGIRPGEKLHEVLIPRDEMRQTLSFKDMYVICPDSVDWKNQKLKGGKLIKNDFEYDSLTNEYYLTQQELKRLISE